MKSLYQNVSVICMLAVAVLIIFCLIRAVRGPSVPDRIVAVNMIGTMTIGTIAILSDTLGESYLLDVCLIYAMISFLAIVVLTKVYTGVYRERKRQQKEGKKPCSKD
ncbi:MAG: monovalent cation/H+ antiporter complex subunit F [Butyricicoccus sp.]